MSVDPMILDANRVETLRLRSGGDIRFIHPVGCKLSTLVERGLVDCVISDTEDGFSPLGQMRSFLSLELGLKERDLVRHVLEGFPETLERNISSLADWNRFRRDEVTLVAIPSDRRDGRLRGLILIPYDDSRCYKKFAQPEYGGRPHRDFMYNITYEALAYAYRQWGARRIGLSHFSRYGYHRDKTTCQVEAMAHFCDEHEGMESFAFLDPWAREVLDIVREFGLTRDRGVHRSIRTRTIAFQGIDFVDLEWSHPSFAKAKDATPNAS